LNFDEEGKSFGTPKRILDDNVKIDLKKDGRAWREFGSKQGQMVGICERVCIKCRGLS
jgi:hypothetical protein